MWQGRHRLAIRSITCGCFLWGAILFAFENGQEPSIDTIDREHWAFVPLSRPERPDVQETAWCRTAVDEFILAALEAQGLRPLPEADRATILRRLSFDLTGLPPTSADLDEFLQDPRPDAYERQVDRLLATPAYGERWGRHWLDLARFAETDGFEHDKVRDQAWRYRDWLISALNDDLPYDRFLSQQLAGDLLAPGDEEALLATGFLLCGPDMPDINLEEERRHMVLNEMTATIGEVFLGLQFGCAQCHDHKADPISIHDFYRLRAYFDSMAIFKDHPLPQSLEKARIVQPGKKPADSFVRVRGDFRRTGDAVSPAVLRVAVPAGQEVVANTRRDLARWMVSEDNPLVARVIVNRVWQYHFGQGLCSTSSDFGLMGGTPSHPELLDWLALELQHQQWSLKQLHRLLVTSAVYRTASRPLPADEHLWQALTDEDPDNLLWGRFRRRRLDAEEIRDSLLAVSGQLQSQMAGPGIRPPLPPEVVNTLLKDQWPVTQDATQHQRRSIYLFVRRNVRFPLLEVFDQPDANMSCSGRMRTTIAPQALHLLNSEFAIQCAAALANRVAAQTSEPSDQIDVLYRLGLSRSPTPQESAAAWSFLVESGADGLRDLCLAVLNFNEFVFVD